MSWPSGVLFLALLKTITTVYYQTPSADVDQKYSYTTNLSPVKYSDSNNKNISSVKEEGRPTMPTVIKKPIAIPLTSMIELHMTGSENVPLDNLYTEKQFQFTCSVLWPLGNLRWQIVLKNETVICIDQLLNGTKLCPNYSGNEFVTLENMAEHISDTNGTKVEYNNRTSLITFHSSKVSKLICNVPLIPKIWVSLATDINVTDSAEPNIMVEDSDYEIEESGGYITCDTTGFPTPVISWSKNDESISPEIIASSDGQKLTFLAFNNELEGDYKCYAENFMGDDSFTFHVTMKQRTNNDKDSSLETKLIISITVSVAVLTTIMLIIYCRYRFAKRALAKLTKEEIDEFFNGVPISNIDDEEEKNIINIPYNIEYEIPKEKMRIDKAQILGSGQFGQVLKGQIDGMTEIVAFKTTKPDCPMEMFKALLLELKTMAFIGAHSNIVRLIGACTSQIRDGILYIAMELCELGSLEDFFETNRIHYCQSKAIFDSDNYQNCYHSGRFAFQFKDLVIWSQEIATGMEFLADKKVIHSDLAIRNVLLNSKKTAKITDFGLSRRLYQYTNYVKMGEEPLPWRWMAIESIKFNTFSTKSDVWSFGITLWEIFSLGSLPYPGLSWSLEFGNQLESGLRNRQPEHATIEIYEIMKNCWLSIPDERPTFLELKKGLIEFDKYYCS